MNPFAENLETVLWLAARASGVAAYAALVIAVLTGLALRTDAFDALSTRRALRALHDFTSWVWIPFGTVHVGGLVLDTTARIAPSDIVVPFLTPYGQLAIGLGTLSLDVTVVVVATSWAKASIPYAVWRAVHRLSYVAFALAVAHSALAGTDFGSSVIGVLGWIAAACVGGFTVMRLLWPRAAD